MKIKREYKLDAMLPRRPRPEDRSIEKCIYLEKTRAVATNGHILAVVPIETAENETLGVIDHNALKEARRRSKEAILELNNGENTVLPSGQTFKHPLSEGETYPTWEVVVPTDAPVFEIALNSALLATLCDGLGTDRVKLQFYSPTKAIKVIAQDKGGNEDGAWGLLMPIRLKP